MQAFKKRKFDFLGFRAHNFVPNQAGGLVLVANFSEGFLDLEKQWSDFTEKNSRYTSPLKFYVFYVEPNGLS